MTCSPLPIALDSLLVNKHESLAALRSLDQRLGQWRKQGTIFANPTPMVHTQVGSNRSPEVDVVIAGGTLGIILGTALIRRGRVQSQSDSVSRGRALVGDRYFESRRQSQAAARPA